ncbi:MAG: hypothetical protein RIB86_11255 [Imperialibacter sp.]
MSRLTERAVLSCIVIHSAAVSIIGEQSYISCQQNLLPKGVL